MAKFLHENSEFKDLIEIVAQKENINDPYLVEKDYWIMHCLWGLKNWEPNFELKGGTSLSKGYRCIYRFSEDIDLKIVPNQERCGFKVYSGKNHDKPQQIVSRKQYFDWVCNELKGKINGIEDVARDNLFDSDDFQSGGIRLNYKSHFATAPGLKEGILLELGFDKTAPNRPIDISSWALEFALTKGSNFTNNTAMAVHCYEPKYTFVEKLQAVVKKYGQYKRGLKNKANLPENFLRHYYDIYHLIERKDVTEFIGTEEYKSFKKERFKSLDTNVFNSGAFTLDEKADRDEFEKQYNRSLGLYYKDRPTLDQILQRIGKKLKDL